MFILSLPSPISCKRLSEGHTLKCTCVYKAVHSGASGRLSAERRVGDAFVVDGSESTHGAQPKWSNQWEEQISLFLSECQYVYRHRHRCNSNKCIAGLRTHLARYPVVVCWMCWPWRSLDLHLIMFFLTHLVEQLLFIYIAARLVWSFSQQGQRNQARL